MRESNPNLNPNHTTYVDIGSMFLCVLNIVVLCSLAILQTLRLDVKTITNSLVKNTIVETRLHLSLQQVEL